LAGRTEPQPDPLRISSKSPSLLDATCINFYDVAPETHIFKAVWKRPACGNGAYDAVFAVC
ncbi:MAG: hypothetical protein AAGB25_03460, partial [Pseudomonadota bacterium]